MQLNKNFTFSKDMRKSLASFRLYKYSRNTIALLLLHVPLKIYIIKLMIFRLKLKLNMILTRVDHTISNFLQF